MDKFESVKDAVMEYVAANLHTKFCRYGDVITVTISLDGKVVHFEQVELKDMTDESVKLFPF